jgi:hypothetical protein
MRSNLSQRTSETTGNHALKEVSLNVVVSASDETQIATGNTSALVNEFLPQQKAPFYIDLSKIDFDLVSKASTFDISVSDASPTITISIQTSYSI